jgi:AraC-like DNA-binding protein
MFHCRYVGLARGPQYDQWREEFGRRWLVADFEPVEGDSLVNEFRGSEHSFLGLCTMRGTPLHTIRRHETRDWLYLILASGARVHARQRGRSNELGLGQMTLISAAEPARVTLTMKGSRWSIRIPRRFLSDLCRDFDDKLAQPVTASRELTKLLLHQMETAHRFGSKLGPSANHVMAQHILDLVGLCLGADKDAAHVAKRRGLAAARLEAIKADILRALGTSELDLERVAARHRISSRYVQHLFERAGTSFTSFVLEERLRMAYRLLRDPANRWRKVSDIAAAAGFPDVSYFNRAFRARFGATPTDVRTGCQSFDPLAAADDDEAAPLLAPLSVVSQ